MFNDRVRRWFPWFYLWSLFALVLSGCAAPIEHLPSSYLPSSAQMLADEERLALPRDLRAKLDAIATPPCSVAENERPNPKYVGQMLDPVAKMENELVEATLKWIRDNRENEPRLQIPRSMEVHPLPQRSPQAQDEVDDDLPALREKPGAQYTAGFVGGALEGAVPLGPNLVQVGIEVGILPKGTYWAQVGKACGEIASGTAQIVLGCAGASGGIGMSGTGGGAPPGIVLFSASLAMAANGCVTAHHGIDSLIHLHQEGAPPEIVAESPPPPVANKPTGQTPQAEQAPKPIAVKPEPIPEAPPPGTTVINKSPGGTTTAIRRRLAPGEKLPETKTTITHTTHENGSVTTTTTRTKAVPAELKPYNQGGGHHVPAKKAFDGAPGYDPKKALAIPKAELGKSGIVSHAKVTGAQLKRYKAFGESGEALTWEAIAKIEIEALAEAGMDVDIAKATVTKAIQALKDSGITGPIRIPWVK